MGRAGLGDGGCEAVRDAPAPAPVAVSVSDDPDAGLVARAQAGDELAFDALVRRHADRLHTVVARLLDDPHEAEEVTQETFVRAWRSLGRFKGESQFFTWLYRIGVNEARRRGEQTRRRGARAARSLDAEPALELADSSLAPHRRAEQADLRRALERAVRELAPEYRAPLILRDVEGLSTTQAAAVMELGEAAFKSRLHRARLAVRKAVDGLVSEGDA